MAIMTSSQRADCWLKIMRSLNNGVAVIKPELRAAVDATDQWISDNAASFNSALPVEARTKLTARQKAHLLAVVLESRFREGV